MSDEKSNAVLEFDRVHYHDSVNLTSDLSDCSFRLNRGQLMFLLMEKHNTALPFSDLAEGLIDPSSGMVRFNGESWIGMSPLRQSQCRGRIGRVFEHRAWISNLSVYDNIVLGQRYHMDSPEEDLRKMVETLTSMLDLKAVQDIRPDNLRPSELKRYEWVRAFLGKSDLILLHEPEEGVRDIFINQLVKLVHDALSTGSSVFWITSDERSICNNDLRPSYTFSMSEDKIVLSMEE